MKFFKYFFVILLAIAAVSCDEDPTPKSEDDPITIPPPKPGNP